MIVVCVFITLALATFLSMARKKAMERVAGEWLLDAAGLIVPGVLGPAVQIWLGQKLYSYLFPDLRASLDLSPVFAILLNFVLVDYLYYWNHRLLHAQALWPFHSVHHSAKQFDFLMTSRNTLWTHGLSVYLWVNGFFVFVLRDPRAFILSASITAGLELWRHTCFGPKQAGRLDSLLSSFLILPRDHAVHHGRHVYNLNFGANLNFWDRLHGTYRRSDRPVVVGIPLRMGFTRQLLWPFSERRSGLSRGGASN